MRAAPMTVSFMSFSAGPVFCDPTAMWGTLPSLLRSAHAAHHLIK
jgi:hypothetical protein